MKTIHEIFFKDSSNMSEVESNSIDLMVTSPPYPMIEMWDSLFSSLNGEINQALEEKDSKRAFNLMHYELDKVWGELSRVLKPGGIVCINIGDATRKINKIFQLFPNHVRISNYFHNNGYIELPSILWRKQTNSPNKFLGSGMLPPNAYITLEHEYILIFRKGTVKREITPKFKKRYQSAFFWEERNRWFSDIWEDIKGTSQNLNTKNYNEAKIRTRSGSYPLVLPYRLINMFSMYEDYIIDPFWGTGTTSLAAMISGRNSIGYEIYSEFKEIFKDDIINLKRLNLEFNNKRISQHLEFIKKYKKKSKDLKYSSVHYKFPVMTKQEIEILLYSIKDYIEDGNKIILNYEKFEFTK